MNIGITEYNHQVPWCSDKQSYTVKYKVVKFCEVVVYTEGENFFIREETPKEKESSWSEKEAFQTEKEKS